MNRKQIDLSRALQALVFCVWLGAFAWLVASGNFRTFLRPEFAILLLMGCAILIGFLAAIAGRVRAPAPHAASAGPGALAAAAQRWVRAGILILPLFYALPAQHQTLGVYAFQKRSVGRRSTAPAAGATASPMVAPAASEPAAPAPDEPQVAPADNQPVTDEVAWEEWEEGGMDEGGIDDGGLEDGSVDDGAADEAAVADEAPAVDDTALAAAGDAEALTMEKLLDGFEARVGKTIATEGMAYREEGVPEGCFLLFRFQIICCVADAQPLWLLIKSSDLSAVKNDVWFRIEGKAGYMDVDGEQVPYIDCSSLKRIKKPEDPYLY